MWLFWGGRPPLCEGDGRPKEEQISIEYLRQTAVSISAVLII